jgi:hypothetical protein
MSRKRLVLSMTSIVVMLIFFSLSLTTSQQSASAHLVEPTACSCMTSTGTIQRAEVTTYMYGEYILVDGSGKTLYALTSHTLDLSQYIGRNVKITGTFIDGYPVDGGPLFLDVQSVS